MIRTIVFVEDGRWLRLEGPVVTARGDGWATVPAPADGAEVVAVVPGDAVVLHWVELPDLAPAQMAAAARMLAADVSAAPVETVHVAAGKAGEDGFRPLALVDRGLMAHWLAQLAEGGIEADHVVPAPLMLPVAGEAVSVFEHGGLWLAHGTRLGFAAEPALARLMIGERAAAWVLADLRP